MIGLVPFGTDTNYLNPPYPGVKTYLHQNTKIEYVVYGFNSATEEVGPAVYSGTLYDWDIDINATTGMPSITWNTYKTPAELDAIPLITPGGTNIVSGFQIKYPYGPVEWPGNPSPADVVSDEEIVRVQNKYAAAIVVDEDYDSTVWTLTITVTQSGEYGWDELMNSLDDMVVDLYALATDEQAIVNTRTSPEPENTEGFTRTWGVRKILPSKPLGSFNDPYYTSIDSACGVLGPWNVRWPKDGVEGYWCDDIGDPDSAPNMLAFGGTPYFEAAFWDASLLTGTEAVPTSILDADGTVLYCSTRVHATSYPQPSFPAEILSISVVDRVALAMGNFGTTALRVDFLETNPVEGDCEQWDGSQFVFQDMAATGDDPPYREARTGFRRGLTC